MPDKNELGFSKTNVRFFITGYHEGSNNDYKEVNETEFLSAEGVIEYERHSVFENGVRQICLTKNPYGE